MHRSRFLYLARRSDDLWKVGCSVDPVKRIVGLRTEFGVDFTIVTQWDRPHDAWMVEAEVKSIMDKHTWIYGRETFMADEVTIRAAISQAIEICDIKLTRRLALQRYRALATIR